MLASCGAQLGISMRYVINDIELMPRARPKSASPMGRPIAISDPNASSRITTAATRPISSPALFSGCSNAKKRSPFSSICNGESTLASAAKSLRLSRSAALSSSINAY